MRYQFTAIARVNGKHFQFRYTVYSTGICVGLPHGSCLGPLPFIIYINPLTSCLKVNCVDVTDDTSLCYQTCDTSKLNEAMSKDLKLVAEAAPQGGQGGMSPVLSRINFEICPNLIELLARYNSLLCYFIATGIALCHPLVTYFITQCTEEHGPKGCGLSKLS